MISKFTARAVRKHSRHALSRLIAIAMHVVLAPVAIPLALANVRFIQADHAFSWVGHLALEPDLYLKSAILGWGPRHRAIWLAPRGSVVNPSLLRHWGRYLRVIENKALVKFLRPLQKIKFLQHNTSWVSLRDGRRVKIVPAHYQVQAEYESDITRRPLLSISDRDCKEGWSLLHAKGVPEDAWFVSLHVREGGYHPETPYHSYRDADISTYSLAIEEIVDRGGWVIRMGDPTMTPLPDMKHVIDYACGDFRSDWMDLFCFSECKFVLGTTSGAVDIACGFGAPVAFTNFAPMGHGPYSGRDIWIPKMYWSQEEDRHLTFEEVLLSPSRHYGRNEDFENQRISLIDNTPEEIRDLTIEAFERAEGSFRESIDDCERQNSFMSLLEYDPAYATNARVGRKFLGEYSSLLPARE